MKITVLGVGLIGGSIGLAARERLGALVSGFDPDAGTRATAIERGAIDEGHDEIAAACEGAEVVFCAAPVAELPELAEAALAVVGAAAVVTDVGSVKRAIAERLAAESRFIGGHPLAGAETAGVGHARADLFDGARWYLTPTDRTEGVLYDKLQRVVAEIGARPQAIDAGAHDRMMAAVSHVPHAVANALASEAAGVLSEPGEPLPEAGPSFRDATRVAGANPAIWGDIFIENREAVATGIDAIVAHLQDAAGIIRSGDRTAVEAWHRRAGERRRELLSEGLSGGELTELRVIVPNRPGIVAEIALALGHGGVNIEDMALHPASDMRSGAISLFIAGPEHADRAVALLGELGHDVSPVGR